MIRFGTKVKITATLAAILTASSLLLASPAYAANMIGFNGVFIQNGPTSKQVSVDLHYTCDAKFSDLTLTVTATTTNATGTGTVAASCNGNKQNIRILVTSKTGDYSVGHDVVATADFFALDGQEVDAAVTPYRDKIKS